MSPTIHFDTRELDAAIAEKLARKPGDLAKIANQAAFNVAARAMRGTKAADGSKVRAYLGAWIGATVVNGRVQSQAANRFGSRHKRASRQLRRVLLIAQAKYFAKHGHGIGKGKSNKRTKRTRQLTAQQTSLFGANGKRKANDYGYSLAARANKRVIGSDYGQAMMRYVGKVFSKNVRSVGYLKAVWVGALRQLAPLARFKGLATGLPYGVKWKTGSAFGNTVAAQPGAAPVAVLSVGASAPRMTAKAQAVVKAGLERAIAEESAEMRRHEREIMEGKQ